MRGDAGTKRWWEYYLVRYFMPSIAGVAIVLWLGNIAGEGFQRLLLLPTTSEINAPRVILLLLYGNLFCYVASYPILSFHATRVLEFKNSTWPHSHLWNGYIATTALSLAVVFSSLFLPNGCRYWCALSITFAFSVCQVARICMSKSNKYGSPAYGYACTLAKRRGLQKETQTEALINNKQGSMQWGRDLMETYRHMREHGNSGFIFLLELILAGLAYCIVDNELSKYHKISAVGILFAFWTFPAALVHMLAQHLERRFSHYDFGGQAGDEAD